MHPDGLNRLKVAIVKRTAQDYLQALRILHRYGNNPSKQYYCSRAEHTVMSCESFFLSDCDYFMDFDGEWLMNEVKARSYDPHFRIKGEAADP